MKKIVAQSGRGLTVLIDEDGLFHLEKPESKKGLTLTDLKKLKSLLTTVIKVAKSKGKKE